MTNILSREQVIEMCQNGFSDMDATSTLASSHLALLDENAALKAECERMKAELQKQLAINADSVTNHGNLLGALSDLQTEFDMYKSDMMEHLRGEDN